MINISSQNNNHSNSQRVVLEIKPKITKYYIQPKEIQLAYDKSLEKGEPTRELLDMFFKIAKNLVKTFNNVNKIDADSAVNYAACCAWKKWNKFDTNVGDNLFAYFTSMILNDLQYHHNYLTRNSDRHISIDSLYSSNKD